ncbi:MAG: class I SAM-dependent methyltransferase [Bacteroidota bacterium]
MPEQPALPYNYLAVNQTFWNNKTKFHADSAFYDVAGFLAGATSLNPVELGLLGDLSGKKLLHLQCHFGQDTISLARLGAEATGVDLSDTAIKLAGELAEKTGTDAKFICSDIYELPNVLNEKFDIVFTSYGTIGWLPDMDKWAAVIAKFLNPGGKFIFVDFHPVVWMFDYNFREVGYSYFNTGPIIETESGTYADRDAPITQESVSWNHSMGEVITGLIHAGLEITSLGEYNWSPYNCFNETEEYEPKKFRIKHLENKIPMVYSIVAALKS